MNRRDFLNSSLLLSGGVSLGNKIVSLGKEELPAGEAAAKRPNILMIICDEFNAQMAGAFGNKIVHTPNIDKLAESGVNFSNCYSSSPICCPARLSLVSGKYISRTGVWGNHCWLPSNDISSLATVLQERGYETVLDGKMHFDKTRRYGFTELFPGWENQHVKNGIENRRAPDDTSINHKDWEGRSSTFRTGTHSPHILGHDEKVTKHGRAYFKQRSNSDKPFFMIAGYLAPHFPLVVPDEYYNMYKGKLSPAKTPPEDLAMQPRNYHQLRRGFGTVDMDPEVELKGRELYYGLVSWVDNQIGQLLEGLNNSEVGKDTVVIFTSDHGENMGEHGMWWKNCMYDSAARVPLIIHWPARWKGGQGRSQACGWLDVGRTIADLAGAGVPDDWDGDSMVDWLDNGASPWKDFAISEYYAKNTSSGYVMYRSGDYKYVYHSKPLYSRPLYSFPRERQLFDMKRDPREFINLAKVPDYQQKIREMHDGLIAVLGEDPDVTERRCFSAISIPYHRAFDERVPKV